MATARSLSESEFVEEKTPLVAIDILQNAHVKKLSSSQQATFSQLFFRDLASVLKEAIQGKPNFANRKARQSYFGFVPEHINVLTDNFFEALSIILSVKGQSANSRRNLKKNHDIFRSSLSSVYNMFYDFHPATAECQKRCETFRNALAWLLQRVYQQPMELEKLVIGQTAAVINLELAVKSPNSRLCVAELQHLVDAEEKFNADALQDIIKKYLGVDYADIKKSLTCLAEDKGHLPRRDIIAAVTQAGDEVAKRLKAFVDALCTLLENRDRSAASFIPRWILFRPATNNDIAEKLFQELKKMTIDFEHAGEQAKQIASLIDDYRAKLQANKSPRGPSRYLDELQEFLDKYQLNDSLTASALMQLKEPLVPQKQPAL